MKKQPGYTIFLALTILSTIAAVFTLLPHEAASTESLLGYKAHCTFAPISTILCLGLAAVFCKIRSKKFKTAK
ncbi:MAG: hypothetical protein JXX29_10400 [Deltaproteobacteria bacterium]|nr:hypothetical protein [Deltaproteobacteria bacterium]MBN2672077.1 hypothetical protein [Deltaproteobacteria bacterium]